MDAETLAGAAGALLAVLFGYVPGLSGWYARLGEGNEELGGVYRRLVMLGALVMAAVGSYGLACLKAGATFGLELSCDGAGLAGLVRALVLALAANQATYLLAVRRTTDARKDHGETDYRDQVL